MLSSNSSTSYRNWLLDIFSLTSLMLIFYFLWLGSYPLFIPDEGRYSEVAREMITTGDYITPRVNGVAFLDKPILYYWLQALAIHLLGVKEFALRLFPALLGVWGCIVTYIGGRQLFNRRTGLFSAIILATTPLYFGGSHYANLDLEVAVWISSALLFFMMGIHRKETTRIYFYFSAYFFIALACLTKGLIGIVFPGMIIGAWIFLLGQWHLLKKIYLVPGLLFSMLIILPWYVLVQKANPSFLHYFFITQQFSRFLSAGIYNNPSPVWFYVPVVLGGGFPWTSFLISALLRVTKKVWQARHHHTLELYLLLWISIIFGFFSIPHSKTISYIFPILPALALLIGNFLSTCSDQNDLYFSRIMLIIGCMVLAGTLLFIPSHQWFDFAPDFNPYLIIIAILLLLGALGTLLTIHNQNQTIFPLFSINTLLSTLILFILLMGASHLNQNTAKPLVEELKTYLQPEDEVINYFKYYQDIPLYLGRRISIVAKWDAPTIAKKDNWMRELWYGMPLQKTDDWLINESTFWKRWHSDKRIFVFVNDNYLEQFKKQTTHYFYLKQFNDIILISNQPKPAFHSQNHL